MELILKKCQQFGTLAKRDEHGQSLVEYALLLLLVAIASIVAVGAFGQTTLRELWGPIEESVLPILGL